MKSQMRNSITVAAVCLFAVAAVAQKSNVVSAYGYMNKQQWAKAIEVIEPATTNETSKSMAKTWWYRGQIYHGVASSQEADVKALMAGNDVILFPLDVPEAIKQIKKALIK